VLPRPTLGWELYSQPHRGSCALPYNGCCCLLLSLPVPLFLSGLLRSCLERLHLFCPFLRVSPSDILRAAVPCPVEQGRAQRVGELEYDEALVHNGSSRWPSGQQQQPRGQP